MKEPQVRSWKAALWVGAGVTTLAVALFPVLNAVVDEDPAIPAVTASASSAGSPSPSPSSQDSAASLLVLLEDVASSTGYRYGATDDEGATLDTL